MAVDHLVMLGGSGFVGSAVMQRLDLASDQNVMVQSLVRRPRGGLPHRSNKIIRGSLPDVPAELFPKRPYMVLHFATRVRSRDPKEFYTVNVEGTKNLLSRLTDECQGIIYGSSASVYGQGNILNIDETQPLCPQTILAQTRARAEEMILEEGARRNIGVCTLRPRFIFGFGDRFTMPGLLKLLKRGLSIGSGRQQFTIIDVEDYAALILKLASLLKEQAESGLSKQQALNIGYQRAVSFNEVTSAICKAWPMLRPRLKLPVFHPALRTLGRLPITPLKSLITQLELIGLDHVMDVSRLIKEVGTDIPQKNPLLVLYRAALNLSSEVYR